MGKMGRGEDCMKPWQWICTIVAGTCKKNCAYAASKLVRDLDMPDPICKLVDFPCAAQCARAEQNFVPAHPQPRVMCAGPSIGGCNTLLSS